MEWSDGCFAAFKMEGLPLATWMQGLPGEVIFNLQIQLIYLFIYFLDILQEGFGTKINRLARNFDLAFSPIWHMW